MVSDGETESFGDALKNSMETIIGSNVTSVGSKSVTGVKVAEVKEGRHGLHYYNLYNQIIRKDIESFRPILYRILFFKKYKKQNRTKQTKNNNNNNKTKTGTNDFRQERIFVRVRIGNL